MEATIEYRVRPVTRYIVTEFEQRADGACGVGGVGEFNSYAVAEKAAKAFVRAAAVDERTQNPLVCIIDHEGRTYRLTDGEWREDIQAKGD